MPITRQNSIVAPAILNTADSANRRKEEIGNLDEHQKRDILNKLRQSTRTSLDALPNMSAYKEHEKEAAKLTQEKLIKVNQSLDMS